VLCADVVLGWISRATAVRLPTKVFVSDGIDCVGVSAGMNRRPPMRQLATLVLYALTVLTVRAAAIAFPLDLDQFAPKVQEILTDPSRTGGDEWGEYIPCPMNASVTFTDRQLSYTLAGCRGLSFVKLTQSLLPSDPSTVASFVLYNCTVNGDWLVMTQLQQVRIVLIDTMVEGTNPNGVLVFPFPVRRSYLLLESATLSRSQSYSGTYGAAIYFGGVAENCTIAVGYEASISGTAGEMAFDGVQSYSLAYLLMIGGTSRNVFEFSHLRSHLEITVPTFIGSTRFANAAALGLQSSTSDTITFRNSTWDLTLATFMNEATLLAQAQFVSFFSPTLESVTVDADGLRTSVYASSKSSFIMFDQESQITGTGLMVRMTRSHIHAGIAPTAALESSFGPARHAQVLAVPVAAVGAPGQEPWVAAAAFFDTVNPLVQIIAIDSSFNVIGRLSAVVLGSSAAMLADPTTYLRYPIDRVLVAWFDVNASAVTASVPIGLDDQHTVVMDFWREGSPSSKLAVVVDGCHLSATASLSHTVVNGDVFGVAMSAESDVSISVTGGTRIAISAQHDYTPPNLARYAAGIAVISSASQSTESIVIVVDDSVISTSSDFQVVACICLVSSQYLPTTMAFVSVTVAVTSTRFGLGGLHRSVTSAYGIGFTTEIETLLFSISDSALRAVGSDSVNVLRLISFDGELSGATRITIESTNFRLEGKGGDTTTAVRLTSNRGTPGDSQSIAIVGNDFFADVTCDQLTVVKLASSAPTIALDSFELRNNTFSVMGSTATTGVDFGVTCFYAQLQTSIVDVTRGDWRLENNSITISSALSYAFGYAIQVKELNVQNGAYIIRRTKCVIVGAHAVSGMLGGVTTSVTSAATYALSAKGGVFLEDNEVSIDVSENVSSIRALDFGPFSTASDIYVDRNYVYVSVRAIASSSRGLSVAVGSATQVAQTRKSTLYHRGNRVDITGSAYGGWPSPLDGASWVAVLTTIGSGVEASLARVDLSSNTIAVRDANDLVSVTTWRVALNAIVPTSVSGNILSRYASGEDADTQTGAALSFQPDAAHVACLSSLALQCDPSANEPFTMVDIRNNTFHESGNAPTSAAISFSAQWPKTTDIRVSENTIEADTSFMYVADQVHVASFLITDNHVITTPASLTTGNRFFGVGNFPPSFNLTMLRNSAGSLQPGGSVENFVFVAGVGDKPTDMGTFNIGSDHLWTVRCVEYRDSNNIRGEIPATAFPRGTAFATCSECVFALDCNVPNSVSVSGRLPACDCECRTAPPQGYHYDRSCAALISTTATISGTFPTPTRTFATPTTTLSWSPSHSNSASRTPSGTQTLTQTVSTSRTDTRSLALTQSRTFEPAMVVLRNRTSMPGANFVSIGSTSIYATSIVFEIQNEASFASVWVQRPVVLSRSDTFRVVLNPATPVAEAVAAALTNATAYVPNPWTLRVTFPRPSQVIFRNDVPLTFVLLPGLFEDRRSLVEFNFTILRIPDPVPVDSTVLDAARTTGAVASVTAGLTGSPTTAVQASRLGLLTAIQQCDGALDDQLDWAESPTQISTNAPDGSGPYIGAVVGNLIVLIAFGVLQWLCCFIFAKVRKTTVAVGMQRMRFPSACVFPAMLLMEPTFAAAFTVFALSRSIVALIAVIAVLLLVTGLIARVVHFLRSEFQAVYIADARLRLRDGNPPSKLEIFFDGPGKWRDRDAKCKGFVDRTRLLYAEYHGECRWYLLVEIAMSALLGVVVLMIRLRACDAAAICALIVWVGYVGLALWQRPFTSKFGLAFALLTSLGQLIGSVMNVAYVLGSRDPVIADATNIVMMITTYVVAIRSFADLILAAKRLVSSVAKWRARKALRNTAAAARNLSNRQDLEELLVVPPPPPPPLPTPPRTPTPTFIEEMPLPPPPPPPRNTSHDDFMATLASYVPVEDGGRRESNALDDTISPVASSPLTLLRGGGESTSGNMHDEASRNALRDRLAAFGRVTAQAYERDEDRHRPRATSYRPADDDLDNLLGAGQPTHRPRSDSEDSLDRFLA
jgi:hypothetical protein